MTLEAAEDITPYDVYSTLTVRDSVPAEHIMEINDLLIETILDDTKPDRLCVSQPPRTAKSSLITPKSDKFEIINKANFLAKN